jgi:DNA-binding transcriptional LysR family regulator
MKLCFMIQLHRLEGFYYAAKTLGFARAARAFPYPITAPAVYQQVRKLEEELSATLLLRVGKDQLALTSAGRTLFAYCEPFLRELPALARSLREGTFGGTLRIDAAALEVQHFLPAWLAQLALARPDIVVAVEEVPFGDATRVLRGETDVLVEYQPELASGLAAHRVGDYFAFLIAPSGRLRSATQRSVARALRGLPFVGFPAELPQRLLQTQGLVRLGLGDVAPGLVASSTEALLAFVRAGLGFSLIPWPEPAGPQRRGVDVLALRGEGTRFPVLATYRSSPEDPLVRAALGALRA